MDSTEQMLQSFFDGINYSAQDFFGVHEQDAFYIFRVWAPRASKVMLTGDFNAWRDDTPMQMIADSGVWEIKISKEKIPAGSRYKYRIYGNGQVHYKSDPYALGQMSSPESSSIVARNIEYPWKDSGWLKYRREYQTKILSRPLNIYGVHLSSWRKRDKRSLLNYREYARELAPYVKQMGYTHISITPVMEYTADESLGYTPSSFFVPASRYGTPDDFKAFVDKMHESGIGVIFDWPITGFPKEQFGIFEFDGAPLYEYSDIPDETGDIRRFDLSKNEVRSFLISSVLYWIRTYHVDMIRISNTDIFYSFVDSESDKSRKIYDNAVDFLTLMNSVIKKEFPDVITIVQGRLGKDNDIGFDLAFDSDWSKDTLEYTAKDPIYRKYHHGLVKDHFDHIQNSREVFSFAYKDVCYGKQSLIGNMWGDYWQKFANARALLGLLMTMRGKKLLFMSSEIAQFREWGYDKEIEWFLLDYESHEKFQRYVAELNNFYLSHSALWQRDAFEDGCKWIDSQNDSQSIIAFRRISDGEDLTVVINFTPVVYKKFRVGAVDNGSYSEIFNSDSKDFYGSGVVNEKTIKTQPIPYHGCKNSFSMTVPPLGISILRFDKKSKGKKQEK